MTTIASVAPRPSEGSPQWATRLAQDLTDWVMNLRRGPQKLTLYTVATAPTAANYRGAMIHVSDESGGEVPAFSDGTNWRRVTDRAVIS